LLHFLSSRGAIPSEPVARDEDRLEIDHCTSSRVNVMSLQVNPSSLMSLEKNNDGLSREGASRGGLKTEEYWSLSKSAGLPSILTPSLEKKGPIFCLVFLLVLT
jgi:hypothetical protein